MNDKRKDPRSTDLPDGWYDTAPVSGTEFNKLGHRGAVLNGKWVFWGWADSVKPYEDLSLQNNGWRSEKCMTYFSTRAHLNEIINRKNSDFKFIGPIKFDLDGNPIPERTKFADAALPILVVAGLLAGAKARQLKKQRIAQQASVPR